MMTFLFVCARCAIENDAANRTCKACGLPLGAMRADPHAGRDAIDPYEEPDADDPDVDRLIRQFAARSGFRDEPSGNGRRVIVPLSHERLQAVYLSYAGRDADDRPIVALVSVCGPAFDRDTRNLLRLNARIVEGCFAIKSLRGEEYCVVVRNLTAAEAEAESTDAAAIVARIARLADSLERRLSKDDIY